MFAVHFAGVLLPLFALAFLLNAGGAFAYYAQHFYLPSSEFADTFGKRSLLSVIQIDRSFSQNRCAIIANGCQRMGGTAKNGNGKRGRGRDGGGTAAGGSRSDGGEWGGKSEGRTDGEGKSNESTDRSEGKGVGGEEGEGWV